MYEVKSSTMSEEYKANEVPLKEWKFRISNGNTAEMIISDQLLDTINSATERAKSEFLKNSYKLREVRFSTHLTNFTKNMVINIQGLPYLVKSIGTVVNMKSMKITVRAIRYE